MRCMNSPAGYDGWALSAENQTHTGFEQGLLHDVLAGEAGASEALVAFRKLSKDAAGDDDGGMYAQHVFESEYRGYTVNPDGSMKASDELLAEIRILSQPATTRNA